MPDARERQLEEIRKTEEALKTAKNIHRRDLLRQLHYLQRDLKIYDKYQKEAKRG